MRLSVLVRGPSQQVSGVLVGRSPGSSEPLPSSPGALWKLPCRSAHNGNLGCKNRVHHSAHEGACCAPPPVFPNPLSILVVSILQELFCWF